MRRNAMRPVFFLGLLGSALSVSPAVAQSSTDPAAATPAKSTAAPESTGGHHAWLFENGPEPRNHTIVRPATGRKTQDEAAPSAPAPESKPQVAAPIVPTVQAVAPGPPQKNLTGDEFKLIHQGSTKKQVLEILGPPSSLVAVPDDDDHLRETLQYWVKGAPMATVRLDDGRVVEIETRAK
jgi:hypothetical protein